MYPEIERSWTWLWLKYREQRGRIEDDGGSIQIIYGLLGSDMEFDGIYYYPSSGESLKAEMS